MPKYQCPECKEIIDRENPVTPGKKLRCRSCGHIFKPVALKEDPSKKGKKPEPPKPKFDDEGNEIGAYGVSDDSNLPPPPEVEYGSLRKKFPKKKTRPGELRVMLPSRMMLFLGIGNFVTGLFFIIAGVWGFLFFDERPTGNDAKMRWAVHGIGWVNMVSGSVIVWASNQMNHLESIPISMAGGIVSILFGLGGIVGCIVVGVVAKLLSPLGIYFALMGVYIGVYVIKTLQHPEVKLAFEEQAQDKKEKYI